MILDMKLTFSENQAVTATAISQNVLEFRNNGIVYGESAAIPRNLGPGNELPLLVQVTEPFNNLTSLAVTLESSAAADLSASTVHLTQTFTLAQLIAGARFNTRVLPDGVLGKFLGMRYTVVGTAPTTGKITAALATEVNT